MDQGQVTRHTSGVRFLGNKGKQESRANLEDFAHDESCRNLVELKLSEVCKAQTMVHGVSIWRRRHSTLCEVSTSRSVPKVPFPKVSKNAQNVVQKNSKLPNQIHLSIARSAAHPSRFHKLPDIPPLRFPDLQAPFDHLPRAKGDRSL